MCAMTMLDDDTAVRLGMQHTRAHAELDTHMPKGDNTNCWDSLLWDNLPSGSQPTTG